MANLNFIEMLEKELGRDRVYEGVKYTKPYSFDASIFTGSPEAIVFPESTDEVVRIIKFARNRKIPVTPRGAGTSVTGAVIPVAGGIIMDLSRMDKIISVDPTSLVAVVEPGVVLEDLNSLLKDYNLLFPPDPGSSSVCTIGGMISTNASGMRGVRYGTTRNYILGLEVVTGKGEIIQTGSMALKNSEGLDLTHLFVGTEGVFGVITKAYLRLLPREMDIVTATSYFNSYEEIADFITALYGEGVLPHIIEVMDPGFLKAVRDIFNLQIEEGILVLLELSDGDFEKIKDHLDGFIVAKNERERDELWKIRRFGYPAVSNIARGYRAVPVVEDVAVPISKIPQLMDKVKELSDKYGIFNASFGHFGDGNVHVTTSIDIHNSDMKNNMKKFYEEFHEFVRAIGGTVSAEHGMGLIRARYFKKEQIETIKALKKVFDPDGILNPGKMDIPDEVETILDSPPDFPDGLGELIKCTFCGFCRKCPIYVVTKNEAYTPRAKVIASGYGGSRDIFHYCSTCKLCEKVCLTGIDIGNMVHYWRKNIMFPEKFTRFGENILVKNNPFGEEKRLDDAFEVIKNRKNTLLYFAGCMATLREKEIAKATISLLKKLGIDFTMLENEPCCASILLRVGMDDVAEKNARKLVEAFENINPPLIVTSCAGCYKTLSQDLPALTGREFNIKHIVQFLASEIPEMESDDNIRITYHDPCHLGRHAEIYEEPREILKKIQNIDFVEMERNREYSFCCGAGGGVRAYDPKVSTAIARERIKQAREVGAEKIITPCPFCVNNLNTGEEGVAEDFVVFLDRLLK
jgi:glycolate oxidase